MSSYWATSPTSSAPSARRRATVSSTLSTVNMTLRRPSVFGGAIAGSISTSFGLRNFVSSSRPCPSGVRIIAMSTWTLSSPLTRSTDGPSTGAAPSSVMPSAVKKAIAPARSSTTTLTWSNLLIVMSLAWQRPCAAEDGQLLAAGVRELRFHDASEDRALRSDFVQDEAQIAHSGLRVAGRHLAARKSGAAAVMEDFSPLLSQTYLRR